MVIRKIDKVMLINNYLPGVKISCSLYYKPSGGLRDVIPREFQNGELVVKFCTYNYNRDTVTDLLNEYFYQVKQLLGEQYGECLNQSIKDSNQLIENKVKNIL